MQSLEREEITLHSLPFDIKRIIIYHALESANDLRLVRLFLTWMIFLKNKRIDDPIKDGIFIFISKEYLQISPSWNYQVLDVISWDCKRLPIIESLTSGGASIRIKFESRYRSYFGFKALRIPHHESQVNLNSQGMSQIDHSGLRESFFRYHFFAKSRIQACT